jgi:hypothetical protein
VEGEEKGMLRHTAVAVKKLAGQAAVTNRIEQCASRKKRDISVIRHRVSFKI